MGLTASLQIGRTALIASQAAMQVTGNNLANAATPGYNRQVLTLSPEAGGIEAGNQFFGRGVSVEDVRRQVDTSLLARLRTAISDQESSQLEQGLLSQVESILGELREGDLSTELSKFFNAFSELANNPNAAETRSVIVEQGATLAGFIQRVRSNLFNVQSQTDDQLTTLVSRADELIGQIAKLNGEITVRESGRAIENSLRDQRDILISELSELVEISVIEAPNGGVDILTGSAPLVLGTLSRGLNITFQSNATTNTVDAIVAIADKNERITPVSGKIGALLAQRQGLVQQSIADLDQMASALIHEVNRLHSSGQPLVGLTNTTGALRVPVADQALAFNDPTNATFAAFPVQPTNGSFVVSVRNTATGEIQKVRIDVDLDGIDATGAPGFANDTTMAGVAAAINGVANLTAAVTIEGRLNVQAGTGFEFSFENDTSGALSALGVNTFFVGDNASDIAVRSELRTNPLLVVSGTTLGDNDLALSIADLNKAASTVLSGVSITEAWRRTVDRVAVQSDGARVRSQANAVVRESLEAQRLSVSGVSVDEESINLITQQRQFQAAARFISAIDEMTQILLGLV